MNLVVLVVAVALVTAWRQRSARRRQASADAPKIAPAALRHPDDFGTSARWIHGTVDLGNEPAVFTARPDAGATQVVLDSARFDLESVTSGHREVMAIAPGMEIVRLISAQGPLEVALQPADAAALAMRFR